MEEIIRGLKDKNQIQSKEYKEELIEKLLMYTRRRKNTFLNKASEKDFSINQRNSYKEKQFIYSNYTKELMELHKDYFEITQYLQFETLINSLNNEKLVVRKSALEILLLLLQNHKDNQYLLLKEMNLIPIGEVVCLNWLPKNMNKIFEKMPMKYINDIQKKAFKGRNFVYNYNNNNNNSSLNFNSINNLGLNFSLSELFWMYPPNYKIYNDGNIPDPETYIVGFYVEENAEINEDIGLFKSFSKEVDEVDYNYLISRIEDYKKRSSNITNNPNNRISLGKERDDNVNYFNSNKNLSNLSKYKSGETDVWKKRESNISINK